MLNYRFARDNRRFLLFGTILTLISTFGQTTFLAIFTDDIQEAFSLTSGQIGLIYSLATLLSAATVTWTGGWIDRVPLQRFTLFVALTFSAACLSMTFMQSIPFLFISYFLLRYTCQGLMSHTSMVSMARYYHDERGAALSAVALGYPLGEATIPLAAAFLLPALGFKGLWLGITIFALLCFTPLLMRLLKGHDERHAKYLETIAETKEETSHTSQVLTDWRFYCIIIGIMAPGYINTGIFFQHSTLIETKGWQDHIYATTLVNFAIGNIVGSLIAGYLVDLYKSVRIIGFSLLPMLAALILLYVGEAPGTLYGVMLGIGISQGTSSVIIGSIWAELYGTKMIGKIRSWAASMRIVFTALSPVTFGYMIDAEIDFLTILFGCMAFTIFSIASLASVTLDQRKGAT